MKYTCSACNKHHEDVRNYVCSNCGFVNPLPTNTNYFTYFNMPCSFTINVNNLNSLYQELVMEYHPDNHVMGTENSKLHALAHSAYLNEGFNVLANNLQRFAYYFELLNNKPIIGEEILHDASVSMEFFSIYEKLDSLNTMEELQDLFIELQAKEQELLQQVEDLDFNNQVVAKKLYILLNYVYKIQQQLQTKKRLMV
ncbi:Co-chaperone protein HscB [Candidatus Hepatincola sp. Av]